MAMERMTLEKVAAVKVRMAADAMQAAARDLRALGTPYAMCHAAEMMGAARMARQWERELNRLHRLRQQTGAVGDRLDCEVGLIETEGIRRWAKRTHVWCI